MEDMQILQSDLDFDDRLGRTFSSYSERCLPENYFLIVHTYIKAFPPGKEVIQSLKKSIEAKLEEGCGGILFVKGTPYGGLGNKEIAYKLQNEYDGKVHFLSYAVANKSDSSGYKDRFKKFFCKIKKDGDIDWDLIDPTYPESIVAALLLLHAALRCSEPENWQNIWKNAVEEYNSRSEEKLKKKLDWNKKEKIREHIEKLKTFLSSR